jgi:hypothetical protein
MAETHVMSALQGKYRRVMGQIAALDEQADKLRTDLDHIEAVIRMFQEDWRAENATAVMPYKPSRWRKHGYGVRTALSVLREATEPMTGREIALAVCARAGMPAPAKKELYTITSPLNMALGRRVGRGVERIEGRPKKFSVVR